MMDAATRRKSKSRSSSEPQFDAGQGAEAMERAVRKAMAKGGWPANSPLPTTREFGQRYQISNVTASRLLRRLATEKVVWSAPNGRFFSLEGGKAMTPVLPYAVMLGRIHGWSAATRAVLRGFTEAFEKKRFSLLLIENDIIVRHIDVKQPPVHATAAEQAAGLQEFVHEYGGRFAGLLLQPAWRDEVLAPHAEQLTYAILIGRLTTCPSISSVRPDYEAAGVLAVGHLFARGYNELWVAVPFLNSPVVDSLKVATIAAAAKLGQAIPPERICLVSTPAERRRFVAKLKSAARHARVGVFCPEDNVASLLWDHLREAGIDSPTKVGLMSGLGTDVVTNRNISTVHVDYQGIGLAAGRILASRVVSQVVVPPRLLPGATT